MSDLDRLHLRIDKIQESQVEMFGTLSAQGAKVDGVNDRLDRLMDLLTPRIEKWDNSSTRVDILMAEREGSIHCSKDTAKKIGLISAGLGLLSVIVTILFKIYAP